MAVDHEITITRGDSFEGRVRWKDSSGTVVTPTAARMQGTGFSFYPYFQIS